MRKKYRTNWLVCFAFTWYTDWDWTEDKVLFVCATATVFFALFLSLCLDVDSDCVFVLCRFFVDRLDTMQTNEWKKIILRIF